MPRSMCCGAPGLRRDMLAVALRLGDRAFSGGSGTFAGGKADANDGPPNPGSAATGTPWCAAS